ncbi:hypothetical protein IRT45_04050 [Nocardia sp. BSTN01]|uniref:hypothetical protein n=1 Tax=Nocardia sp. BSTN01 TaxID=2783665 RepID=UPI00188FF2BF|nr:hypothetical protein [Nocardia sp. BSTN01]MBF4996329.1 hypothetical protein [Nocardia sp. BSTN01]
MSPLSGRVVARIGARASAALGGPAIAAGAGWWIALSGCGASYPLVFLPGAVLAGVSTALLQPPLFGASSLLPPDQLSLGSGTLMMARQTASAGSIWRPWDCWRRSPDGRSVRGHDRIRQ